MTSSTTLNNSKLVLSEKGISVTKNAINDFCVFRLHYSADPEKDEAWAERQKKSYPGIDIWNQEMELDFTKSTGQRIYPEFKDSLHVKDKLQAYPYEHILRFWDFGYRHPVVLFAQLNNQDQLLVLDEIFGTDIVIYEFAKHVKEYTKKNFPGFELEDYCDPAGKFKSDKSNKTSIDILRLFDIRPRYKISQVEEGINLIRKLLLERSDGSTGILVDRKCRILIDGFLGGYTRHEITEEPVKDGFYEHCQDALRYGIINLYSVRDADLVKPDFIKTFIRKTASQIAGY